MRFLELPSGKLLLPALFIVPKIDQNLDISSLHSDVCRNRNVPLSSLVVTGFLSLL